FDSSAIEGGLPAEFSANLSGDSDQVVTVDYETVDGTAKAGVDYVAESDHLTFQPHNSYPDQPLRVPILDDKAYDAGKTFYVKLSNPQGATINPLNTTYPPECHITNTYPPPTLSIDDVSQNEGDSGTTDFTFTVALTGSTSLPTTVNWATADDG